MDFERFEDKYPAHLEGEGFRNRFRFDDLHKEKSEMPRGRWVWVICLLVGATGRALEWSTTAILGTCAALIAIQAMDILVKILQKTQELRIEIELIKGSIRENRWEGIRNRDQILNARKGSCDE